MALKDEFPTQATRKINYHFDCTILNKEIPVDVWVTLPEDARTIVHIVDGSGSGQFSESCQFLSRALLRHGFGTCLKNFASNEITRQNFSDSRTQRCEMLGTVYQNIFRYLRLQKEVASFPFCMLASGGGSPAALYTASISPAQISAIAISGGRLSDILPLASQNTVPTLFIVGSEDVVAGKTTMAAYAAARGPKKYHVIAGAGHLLREPGALEEIAKESFTWFQKFS